MTSTLRRALIPAATVLLGSAALAQGLTILPTGLTVGGMSSDGEWVVGNDSSTGGGYRWSAATGKVTFTSNNTVAVSTDGNLVLCTVDNLANKGEAAIYDVSAGTYTMMDTFVGGGSCDAFYTSGYDMSDDGTVATGLAWEGCTGRAFHWTGAIPMVKLPQLNPGSARGNAVSGDGQYIGGWETAPFGNPWRAWIWTETYGMQDLGAVMQAKGLTLPAPVQTARDITPDGRTIMGAFSSPLGFVGDTYVLEFANPVTDLGGSSAGTGGVHPVLSGEGSFFPTAPFTLRLDDAAGSAISVLIISTQNIPVPLFGGILQTSPITTTQGLLTQPTGDWEIPGTWPAAMTQGLSLYFQAAVFDPAAVGQFALSNGLAATTP